MTSVERRCAMNHPESQMKEYLRRADRADRFVQAAVNTEGYRRLQEIVGSERFVEFQACIVGMAWAMERQIDGSVP